MYALSFDMNIADLKENYGEIYNNAYYEVRRIGAPGYWLMSLQYRFRILRLAASTIRKSLDSM